MFSSQDISNNSRIQNNSLKLWWSSLDRFSIGVIFIIATFSLVMVTTASPAVAHRINVEPFYFMKRQIIYIVAGLVSMIWISFFSVNTVKRFAIIGFFLSLAALMLVFFWGYEVKGAKRWLSIAGLSFQPSEFAKSFFTVLTAWVLSIKYEEADFPAFKVSLALYLIFIALLLMQPDFGMMVSVSIIWIGQLFVAGLSLIWFFALAIFSVATLSCSYIFLPHVQQRIDSFLNPENFENYQIKKSLEAFKHGGFYGVGPGEGVVKQHIPDSHADFIFAVIGEEMGFIVCLFLLIMFALLVIRGLYIVAFGSNNFSILAVSGILIQIGIQSVFNMGMALHLLPTKGIALPLISYGGSSILSTFILLGIMLAFTRKRYDVIMLPTRNYRMNIQ